MKICFKLFFFIFLLPTISLADYVYQEPSEFIKEIFNGKTPEVSILNVIGKVRENATKILDHPPKMLRVRYWKDNKRSAWILEEIGKVKPITAGIVVQSSQIEDVRILIYRESHGDEVRHSFFTKQFHGTELKPSLKLNKSIDGISGATLSVDAIRRLATLALYFDKEVRSSEEKK